MMKYGERLIMSKEHKQFIKKQKVKRIVVFSLQLILLFTLLIIWQLCADKNIINSFISSSPKRVLDTIISLHNQHNLYQHILVTLYETVIGFSLSLFLGLFLASLFWWFETLFKILEPYLTVINSLPKVALGPIMLIWCGANVKTIILMAILISFIVVFTTMYQGFVNIDENQIKLIKSFGGSKWQVFKYLILPGSYNTILSTLKLNISMCLIGVIMGEFLVSKEGIGYLIMYGSQIFNLDLVITGIVILSIVATILYVAICFLEKKIRK